MTVEHITNTLLRGNALEPSFSDLIVQEGRLDAGLPVPDGWRVLDGNMQSSAVARVVMRYEVQDMEALHDFVREAVS